ncbi:hypothetical protein, partial [Paenibacillus timonensis]|uniref:hypothetical protein n=1 Tax=Paenibacillus timonensis TaxID=225915 RepID=UPI001F05F54D
MITKRFRGSGFGIESWDAGGDGREKTCKSAGFPSPKPNFLGIPAKTVRPPKSGVLPYNAFVDLALHIISRVYIDLWNFEVSSSVLTHNENLIGAIR